MSAPPPGPRLRCRECGAAAPSDGPQYCASCFGPVEVVVEPPSGSVDEIRDRIGLGPPSIARYEPLMPAGLRLDGAGAGWTPLRGAAVLGEALGHRDLFLKDETANPTGSFKDRVVEAAVARGVAMGHDVVACSSTGNLARSVAAVAAARGMEAVVVVPEELADADVERLVSLGAHVVRVRGGYDAASRLTADAAADLPGWCWVNVTMRPYYELGARTLAWEIAEQLQWTLPDRIVVPMASGALARAVFDGVEHLRASGLVRGSCRLTTVQPDGCSPVAAAFRAGATRVQPVRPDTVAESLSMGDPPDGEAVLGAARATGGQVVAAPEPEIPIAVDLVSSTEGVAVEPAGGVVVAALADLVAAGTVAPDERVVVVLTGAASPVVPAGVVPGPGATYTIDPSVRELIAALPDHIARN